MILLVAIILLGLYPSMAYGYPKHYTSRDLPLKIDSQLGDQIIETLRNQRPRDYYFQFEIKVFPRRKRSSTAAILEGEIWGSWNEKGPVSRATVYKKHVSSDSEKQSSSFIKNETSLLAQNGKTPLLWQYTPSPDNETLSGIEELKGKSLFEPLMSNIDFTPFDILMPFLFWPDYKYEGKTQTGRQVHRYITYPPSDIKEEIPELGSIRIVIDDQFRALTKIEMLNPEGKTYRSFRIRSFQKVDGQYIIKEIDFFDEEKRSKTRFTVNSAQVNLMLPLPLFLPENLDKKFSLVPNVNPVKRNDP